MIWLEPSSERVERIGRLLRRQDQLEVLCSNGLSGEEAVRQSWRKSEICRCIGADDGTAVGLCGVSGSLIWLLATDGLLASPRDRRQFIREGRHWVDSLFDEHEYDCLHNWTLSSNLTTLRWLGWLGFAIGAPEPMGIGKRLFTHFWRTA